MTADDEPGITRLIEKFIGRNSAPAWSPDGRLLAYYSYRDSAVDVVVRTAATGSERVFSGNPLDLLQVCADQLHG